MNSQSNLETAFPAPSSEGAALSVRIRKRFQSKRSFFVEVDFSVPPGITILFGASGSGKSTILDCISGLLQPDWGRIELAFPDSPHKNSRRLFDSDQRICLPVAERRIAYVFQDVALFPHLTVAANVEYGLATLPRAARAERRRAAMALVDITDLAEQFPPDLSGGEGRRVALARSLVTEPAAVLLDEPLSGLDFRSKSAIVESLQSWSGARRLPILYVTHDREEAIAVGERLVLIEDGKIVQQGTPIEVLRGEHALL